MGYKLHRSSRRSVFRRKRQGLRVVLGAAAAVAIVAGGFFVARFLDTRPGVEPSADTSVIQPDDTSAVPDTSEPSVPTDTKPSTVTTVRGFYLPHSALLDTDALSATLKKAASAGLNTLLFDLKDSNGTLRYRFTCEQAVTVNSYADTALTEEQLTAVLTAAEEAGIQVIPRLFAFRDNAAARALAGARIAHESDPGWVWYDADPANGGKAWLNPYADEAHLYLITLAEELKALGVSGILLDGVQFPTNTYSASFGSSSNTSKSHDEILTAFVDKMQTALGEECPVLLGCAGNAALGVDTVVYGGNPLTFGADRAVPRIDLTKMPKSVTIGESVINLSADTPLESMEAAVHHMCLRLKVTGDSTVLTPWLVTTDLPDSALTACLKGIKNGGAEAYILYNGKGRYPFDALS